MPTVDVKTSELQPEIFFALALQSVPYRGYSEGRRARKCRVLLEGFLCPRALRALGLEASRVLRRFWRLDEIFLHPGLFAIGITPGLKHWSPDLGIHDSLHDNLMPPMRQLY